MRQPIYPSLTLRQTEIAESLVSGKSTREIALELSLSPRTVETHVAAIYNKYGVSSRAELMLIVLGSRTDDPVTETLQAQTATTNLPVRRTGLIGRTSDIEDIVGILRSKRLVTITGAGGIGKTQAALAVGEAVRGDFANGVWLVELATLPHGSPVEGAVARALNVPRSKDLALIDSLVAHLQRQTLLLVVDNCEHVIGELATLADQLMRSCPRLRVLATSREPLRIAGEQTFRLPSLTAPAAIELFTQRARAADFQFALDDENAPLVAEICRKLDGIPLAIELAAARVNVLPLVQLATKIETHLRILAGGNRLALPRHQTMHALIDWSYQLLSPAEQRLFACMSVFAGGCALEQVAAVFGEATDDEITILDRLSSLVDKSLLVVDLHGDEPRYSLLQSFAHYASEKLVVHGETTAVRRRHAIAYAMLAERLEAEYDLSPNVACDSRVLIEFENCVAALDWALDARHDITLGQSLAAAMRPAWILAGGGERWVRIARDLVDERTAPLLAARLDFAWGTTRYAASDHTAALAACGPLVAVFQRLGDPLRAAYAQSFAASALIFLGRSAESEPLIAPALEVARANERWPLIAFILRAGASLSGARGDLPAFREKLIEALSIYERIGARRHTAIVFGTLAECEFMAGNAEYALDLAMQCLNLQRSLGARTYFTLTNISAYNVALNRWDRARSYAREVLGLAQEPHNAAALPLALLHLAAVAVFSASGDAAPGSHARSARLLGYFDSRVISPREYTEQQEFDRVLAALRATMPAEDLGQLMAEGATLTAEQATELGLSI